MPEPDPVERVETIMRILAGKWKPAIIYALVMDGTLRFASSAGASRRSVSEC